MYCLVEITKYPLTPDYTEPILGFIERIKAYDDLDITVGETSSLIRGEYAQVMAALNTEIGKSLEGGIRTAFVLKILNTEQS